MIQSRKQSPENTKILQLFSNESQCGTEQDRYGRQSVTWTAKSIALILAVTAAAATAAAVGIGVVVTGIIWGKFGGVHAYQHNVVFVAVII